MTDIRTDDPQAVELKLKRLEQADPVATMVRDRYRRAKSWRAQEKVGDRSVDQILRDSYNQYHSILSCSDRELVEDSGIDLRVSLTKHKVDVLLAWLRDLMVESAELPFTISPTPIPDLSAAAKAQVLAQVKQALFANAGMVTGPDEVVNLVRTMRQQVLQKQNDAARDAAARMTLLISDQLVESGFRGELMNYLFDFALMPYAVMLGPLVERRPTFTWSGNRAITKVEPMLAMRRIDPANYYWSSDSPGAGQGTYDIVVDTMSRQRLLDCMSMQGYIKANINEALNFYSSGVHERNWLNSVPTPGTLGTTRPWAMDESVDVVHHWGMLSGRELRKYGIMVDEDVFHECEAVVLGYWTIRLLVNPNPNVTQRPVYASSYQKIPGKIAGYGIGQIIKDTERAFMVALRGSIENVGYSVAPLGEVDFSRVQRYIADDQIGSIMAGTMVPVDPDVAGGGRPAHYFHTVPSITGQLTSLMQFYQDQADRLTGLPAALSGQPVGTGVNRTFRGVMALYGNALKGVQSAMTNLDHDLFERMGTAFFNFNMKFAKDDAVRGDAKVHARGTAGLLQKEMAKQSSQEALMLIAQIAQTGAVGPGVMKWAVDQALSANGVPQELIEQDNLRRAAQGEPSGQPGVQPAAPEGAVPAGHQLTNPLPPGTQ